MPSLDELIGSVLLDGMSISIEPERIASGVDIQVRTWAVTIKNASGGSVRVVDVNLHAAILRAQRGIIGTILDPFKRTT